MGPDTMILVFWMLSLKPAFSFSSFTFIKWLFNSCRRGKNIWWWENQNSDCLWGARELSMSMTVLYVLAVLWLHVYTHVSKLIESTSECFILFIVKNNEDWGGNQMSNQNNNTEKIKPQKGEVKLLSCVRLFAIPWTISYQAPPSMKFSRQEYWSGLPFPSPGDLPNQGLNPDLPHCRETLYRLSYQRSPQKRVNAK